MTSPKWASFPVLVLAAVAAAPLAARAQDAPPPPTVTPAAEPPPGPAPALDGSPPPAPQSPSPAPPYPPAPAYPPPPPAYPPPPPAYPPAYPPPPAAYAPPPPVVAFHEGVFLRLHFGVGYASLTGSGGYYGSSKITGNDVSLGIALGGGVGENLALFGNIFVSSIGKTNVTTDGVNTGMTNNGAVFGGFGVGAVYYFMPTNIYISGAIAAAHMDQFDSQGNTIDQTGTGFGFEGIVGKEWRVSQHWGLGAAAEFMGATSMQDKNNPNVSWNGDAFHLLFSATCY